MRRAFEASGDTAQASLADYENVLLTLKADIATNYFAVRTADSQIDVQLRTIKSFQDALNLTNSRFQGGISTQLDVEQAQATLAAAQAQLATLKPTAARNSNTRVAVLVGRAAQSGFSLRVSSARQPASPSIPAGMPSDLLERRPDVAAAERRVAAQNAEIGVAIAAWFPVVHLTGQTGFDSGDLGMLFNWQSRIWAYGPEHPIPDFRGRPDRAPTSSNSARPMRKTWRITGEQVLVAFQDVEDSLSALRYLAQQSEAEQIAPSVAYKQAALDLTNSRYTTGTGFLF